jgi:hypothetical protein
MQPPGSKVKRASERAAGSDRAAYGPAATAGAGIPSSCHGVGSQRSPDCSDARFGLAGARVLEIDDRSALRRSRCARDQRRGAGSVRSCRSGFRSDAATAGHERNRPRSAGTGVRHRSRFGWPRALSAPYFRDWDPDFRDCDQSPCKTSTSPLLRLPKPPRLSGLDSGTAGDGARGTRTPDLLGAIQALSQLSYSPEERTV